MGVQHELAFLWHAAVTVHVVCSTRASQALLESASRELGAMRHILAADELVNNFDMFGALIELHGAQTWVTSTAASM